MLQNIKSFYGKKLTASDGEIGHVLDFYFDDRSWDVRYVVADTGSWLQERQVLLSPHAFRTFDREGKSLQVNLTRKQIENSPSIESHQPVSRQYEEEYHRYYGWPCYWQDNGLLGATAFPILETPPKSYPGNKVVPRLPSKRAEDHLRSALAVNGYGLQASDGKIGYLNDLMLDVASWSIRRLIVKTGWLPGKEVEIPTSTVDRISYEESTVYVNLTGSVVESSARHHQVLSQSPD